MYTVNYKFYGVVHVYSVVQVIEFTVQFTVYTKVYSVVKVYSVHSILYSVSTGLQFSTGAG